MNPTINESSNFYRNLYFIADDAGVGITTIEHKAGMGSGYCSIGLRRNSSPTLHVAKKLSDAVGYSIDDLMKDPKEFRKIVRDGNGN